MIAALYIFALIVGGVFVALSAFSGLGDADADFDADADADLDFDADADLDLDADVEGDLDGDIAHEHDFDDVERGRRYRPWRSFRFYTFFLAFFGLTGLVLTLLGLASPLVTALLALGMGAFAGFGITYAVYVVGLGPSSGIRNEHFVGTPAKVVLPMRRGERGKVRLVLQGKIIEMRAQNVGEDDEVVLDIGDECVVLDTADGLARVVSADALVRRPSS